MLLDHLLQNLDEGIGGLASHVTPSADLKAPQVINRVGSGRYLLAEGGRDRVLELNFNAVESIHDAVDEPLDQPDVKGDGLMDKTIDVIR